MSFVENFTVTIFPNPLSHTKEEKLISLDNLVEMHRTVHAPVKDLLPLVKFAAFGEIRTPKDALRHDRNVLTVSGVEGDYDGGQIDPQEAVENLKRAGIAATISTSPSHTPLKPRWRVLCPFSKPLPPSQRARMLDRLNGVLEGCLSAESWTLSQTYYVGYVDDRVGDYEVYKIDGTPIDLLPELDACAVGKPGRGKHREHHPRAFRTSFLGLNLFTRHLLTERELRAILNSMPNDPKLFPNQAKKPAWLDRVTWVELCHAIAGCTQAASWARTLFVEWSAKFDGDLDEPQRCWDTLIAVRAGFSTLVRLFEDWHGEGSFRELFETDDENPPLTLAQWLSRDTPDPDFLMGNVFSITTRSLFFAPTGIGKTLLMTALGFAMAAGEGFLHWEGRRPSKILFIDGELSRRLMKRRAADAVERFGSAPPGFHVLSFDDLHYPRPLNTAEGQKIIEHTIKRIGQVDFIFFDSVMALTSGSMKDEDTWVELLPWARTLTQRSIGFAWIHHTGHDETRGYGTKTREWGMDVVGQLERLERPDTDVSFRLSFPKARERTPETRADFAPMQIALVDDKWIFEPVEASNKSKGKVSGTAKRFLDALMNVLATGSITTISGRKAVTMDHWQAECVIMGLIDRQARPDSARALFSKYRLQLVGAGLIACEGNLTWRI